MKKTLKSLALAAAFACSVPVAAQAQDAAPAAKTPAQAADEVCAQLATKATPAITCTAEQKAELAALIERVAAMPVTDRYSQMAQQYAFLEGLRQMFFPERPALPQPPKNEVEETAMQLCASKVQQTGIACTREQYAQVVELFDAVNNMPEPKNVEEVQQLERTLREGLEKIFPELRQPQEQTPSNSSPRVRQLFV